MAASRVLNQAEIDQIAAQNRRYFEANPSQTPKGYVPYTAPGAPRTLSGAPVSTTPQPQQSPQQDNLGYKVMQLLVDAQKQGTAKFQTAALNASNQQQGRLATTPSSLIGASPSQQAQVRGAAASAITPTIQGAQQLGQTFGEQLSSFGNSVRDVAGYIQQEADRADAERDKNRKIVNDAITLYGSSAFDVLDKGVLKQAGYAPETIAVAKARLKELETQSSAGEGFTLGEGQARYDAQGNLIASRAKGGGGGGGSISSLASAVIQNPGLFSSLTPSVKSAVIPELQTAGFDTTRLNLLTLPASQQEDITTMATVQNYVNDLLGVASKNNGSLPGVGGLGAGSLSQVAYGQLGIGDAEGETTRNLIGQIKGSLAKLRGGTSFTPTEQKLLDTYTPGINDSDAQAIQKLINLNTFINNKRANLVSLVGGTLPTGEPSSSVGQSQDYNAYLKAIGE